jgi:hypothetical protein
MNTNTKMTSTNKLSLDPRARRCETPDELYYPHLKFEIRQDPKKTHKDCGDSRLPGFKDDNGV